MNRCRTCTAGRTLRLNTVFPPHAFQILDDYNAIVLGYRQKGEPIPRSDRIHSELAGKYGLSQGSIPGLVAAARAARKKGKG